MASFTVPGCEYWMRIVVGMHYGGADALSGLWRDNSITGLPFVYNDSTAAQQRLYQLLDTRNPRGKRVVSVMKSMEPVVFPASKQTDIRRFDVTLHASLLLNNNVTQIRQSPALPSLDMDNPQCLAHLTCIGDFVSYLKQARNYLIHNDP